MEEKVISIIAQYQGINSNRIDINSLLIQDIGLSSFDVIGLVCNFENEFKIEIPDREIAKVRTVKDVVDIISKIKEK